MQKLLSILLILLMVLSISGCSSNEQKRAAEESAYKSQERSMVLATTTSTDDSGLLKYLLPEFEKDTKIKVKVVPLGTGAAIEVGKRGDADCLLVHAKAQEEAFVKEGYGIERFDVMYNDFIIVGPKEDPLKIKEKTPNDPIEALKLISKGKVNFISRGDESGTHSREKELWREINIVPEGSWYISSGKGMGAVLQMADEKKAYTLCDRATYLSMKDKLSLDVIVEKDDRLYNQYGVIAVNPEKNSGVKIEEAQEFVKWILSDKTQKLIGQFGRDKYGQSLFIPNVKKGD